MRLVTHGGRAHRDEFLSSCLALSNELLMSVALVERRDPTPRDLNDPNVIVIDEGGRYDPQMNNFDHHQRSRDEAAECSLSLWSRHVHLGVGEEWWSLYELLRLGRWFELWVRMDARGSLRTSNWLGVDPSVIFRLGSPLEDALLDQLEHHTYLPHTDPFARMMRDLGDSVIQAHQALATEVRRIGKIVTRTSLSGGVPAVVLESSNIAGLNEWRNVAGELGGIGVWFDPNGPGWKLVRFDSDPRVNLNQAANHPNISYVSVDGGMARTRSRVSLGQVLQIANMSLVR